MVGVNFFEAVAMVAVVTPPHAHILDVVWCSAAVVVVVVRCSYSCICAVVSVAWRNAMRCNVI